MNWLRRLFKKQTIVKVFCTKADLKNDCLIHFDGRKLSIYEWAEFIDMNISTLRGRLTKLNWTVEKSLSTPVATYSKRKPKEVPECFADSDSQ